ncbi:hypothetical protein LCGC14_0476620 [marine sediment metagenome]|uniref:Uncharacterized protein n=1 Tax=marine sediment metagenome TaxID=412755 RepID=A0A0F9SFY4_9ZZZZ
MQSEHKKIFAGILFGIFLISLVSADLVFRQGTEVDLKIVCINAGFCTSTAQCNVSIFSPTELLILNGTQATQSDNLAFYNLTLNSSLTTELGEYRVGGFCKDGSVTQVVDFTFDITADGRAFQAFPNQFVFIALAFILIIFGLSNDRLNLLKHMGSIILMVMGVLTLFPGYNFINHSNLFGLSLGTVLIGIGFYFLIEDSFSREKQEERFNQPQGQEEEEFFE